MQIYRKIGIALKGVIKKVYPIGTVEIMNKIAEFVKTQRKAAHLSRERFAELSGLGVRFIRELESGKETLRMDKVNQALAMFGMEAVPGRKWDD